MHTRLNPQIIIISHLNHFAARDWHISGTFCFNDCLHILRLHIKDFPPGEIFECDLKIEIQHSDAIIEVPGSSALSLKFGPCRWLMHVRG